MFGRKLLLRLLTVCFLLTTVNCGEPVPQQAVIKIDPNQKFQIMTGWEATAQAGQFHSQAYDRYRDRLLNDAVNDLGVNRLRVELRSGLENPVDYFALWRAGEITEKEYSAKRYEVINDDGDAFVINPKGFQFSEIDSTIETLVLPMKKLLAERGETLYLNLNFVDFTKDCGASSMRHDDNAEEYAEFVLAAYTNIQSKYGFAPDAVEVVLEPDADSSWTPADIGHAIVAAGNRLRANNFEPAFIVPGTTSAANAPVFIDEIAEVPDAMQFVTEFSYHRYSGVSDEALEAIAERAAKYDKRTAMLEWIGADYKTLHQDLKIGQNSAWQQYTLAFPNEGDNGAQYFLIDDTNEENPDVSMGSRTKFLRQYFCCVRLGAQRIGAESDNLNFDPIAFVNKDGSYVLVIKAAVPGTVSVQGLPKGNYGISYTTLRQSDANASEVTIDADETLSATIPAAGVVTVFAK